MKATVVLEIEVYDEQFINQRNAEPTEDDLSQYISDELGWSFSSFFNVEVTKKVITDKTIKTPESHVVDFTK